jgi:hypothetical protein
LGERGGEPDGGIATAQAILDEYAADPERWSRR